MILRDKRICALSGLALTPTENSGFVGRQLPQIGVRLVLVLYHGGQSDAGSGEQFPRPYSLLMG